MNLDFEITECPKWREDKSKYSPGVKIMLKDIVDYIKNGKTSKNKKNLLNFDKNFGKLE